MMRSFKSGRLFLIVSIVVLVALIGSAAAFMYMRTEIVENQFIPGEVDCTVVEDFNGTEKKSITVQNTGNIDAYIRVRLVTYWVDAEGNITAKPSDTLVVNITDNWIAGSDNTYYCKKAIDPSGYTPELLASNIVLKTEDGYRQVVEVFAEAIQSEPTKAVTNSWKVTVDAEGRIVAVN